ncbi:MAG: tetratricopeptide repeat protein [Candidatus Xenobia bacterium]
MPLFPKKRAQESDAPTADLGPEGETELATVTRRKEQALKRLGEMQFTAATNGFADQEQIDRLIREIQFLDEQIKLVYEKRMKDMAAEPPPPGAPPQMRCQCGAPMAPADAFCRTCGTPRGASQQPLDCAVCQHRIKAGSMFCSFCGARVIVPPQQAAPPPPRPVQVPPVEVPGARAGFKMSVPPQYAGARESGLGDWHEGAPVQGPFAGSPPMLPPDALRPPQIRSQWAAHLEPILNPPQVDPQACMRMGIQQVREGRYIEAIEAFENASRMTPRDPMPRYQLGLVRYRMGDLEGAIGEFERALRISPNLPDAHNDLGLVLTKKGQVREAIHHFRKALQINPQHPDAHYNLGYACLSIGDSLGAATHLDMYLRIAPNAPDARTVNDVLMRLRQQGGV